MCSEEKLVRLQIAHIRLDGGTQVREKAEETVIDEYAERMAEGDVFPPLVVLFDGTYYWLADGFHRLRAALRLGRTEIECRVFEGTQRDAVLVALKANSAHGLRRTNADKIRAVKLVLADEEWSLKSTRWIADVCGVSRKFVEGIRRQLATVATHLLEGESQRLCQDGKVRVVRRGTGAEIAGKAPDPVEQALQTAEHFDSCLTRLKKLSDDSERLARGPGGKYLAGSFLADLLEHLRLAANQLAAARPATRCRFCNGQGCDHCWMSAATTELASIGR